MGYNFYWDGFDCDTYKELLQGIKEEKDGEFYGFIRCGHLCFDITLLNCGDYDAPEWVASLNCYVPYQDTGYGYNENEIPYDFAEGADVTTFPESFEEFKRLAEKEITEFINEDHTKKDVRYCWNDEAPQNERYSLVEKANKELLIW